MFDDLIVRHAEHFLRRLDRLNTAEVDLALGLYRDPGLLRVVLQQVSLPDSADRVALSLGDPKAGPFIVVTRDGHFVTCLGTGMTVGSLPVVTRGQLDGVARRVATLRERMAEAVRLSGGSKRASGQLLRSLLKKPDAVSREEFLAVSLWEPLMAPLFMDLYLAMAAELPLMIPRLLRLKSHKGRSGEALHGYWNIVHSAGHMALLATMGGEQAHYQALTEASPEARAALAFPLTNTGVTRFILVGAWSAGRLGKQLLPAYKRALGDDVAFFELLDTVFALVAIGRRTTRLRGEIGKALRRAPNVARTPHARRLRDVMGDAVEMVCSAAAELLLADDADLDGFVHELGKSMISADATPDPESDEGRLLRTLVYNVYADGLTHGSQAGRSMSLIAAAVRGPPEQFYLPRDILEEMRSPWEPEKTELLLKPHRTVADAYKKPPRRVERQRANDPCACGSGRKYKRCCRP